MNWGILCIIVVIHFGLNFLNKTGRIRLGMLAWAALWWFTPFVIVRFGFKAPLPSSIIGEYMVIATMAVLIYCASDRERWRAVKGPILSFLTEKKFHRPLVVVLIALPLFVGVKTYWNSRQEIMPPFFGRTVHPAPPPTIDFKGKTIDINRGENPFRKLETGDPEKFAEHVEQGKKIYFQNCFYCHGDAMRGGGLYAYGLDPIPTDFQDPATIAMFHEAYLFWRIAKGGRGLPDEAGPWASAMPAWEDFLSEEDIWNVILYLYDYTGNRPRAIEETHDHK